MKNIILTVNNLLINNILIMLLFLLLLRLNTCNEDLPFLMPKTVRQINEAETRINNENASYLKLSQEAKRLLNTKEKISDLESEITSFVIEEMKESVLTNSEEDIAKNNQSDFANFLKTFQQLKEKIFPLYFEVVIKNNEMYLTILENEDNINKITFTYQEERYNAFCKHDFSSYFTLFYISPNGNILFINSMQEIQGILMLMKEIPENYNLVKKIINLELENIKNIKQQTATKIIYIIINFIAFEKFNNTTITLKELLLTFLYNFKNKNINAVRQYLKRFYKSFFPKDEEIYPDLFKIKKK